MSSSWIPVDILDIAEFELELKIIPIPNLLSQFDQDALLLSDRQSLIVDKEEYVEERMQNRLRFSVAHEIGHLVLHGDMYGQIEFDSVEEWLRLIGRIPEREYSFIEYHAYEFAGRLLVPREKLSELLLAAVEKTVDSGLSEAYRTGDPALEYISNSICRPFAVSDQVVQRRLRKEDLWPPETPGN